MTPDDTMSRESTPQEPLRENRHWGKLALTLLTAGSGLALGQYLFAHESSQYAPAQPVEPVPGGIGVALVILALAGTVVTRFWTRYERLTPAAKFVARAAWFPGCAVASIFFVFFFVVFTVGKFLDENTPGPLSDSTKFVTMIIVLIILGIIAILSS